MSKKNNKKIIARKHAHDLACEQAATAAAARVFQLCLTEQSFTSIFWMG